MSQSTPASSGAAGARRRRIGAAVCAALLPLAAQATNGYFPHGYGLKAKGMGGASIAMSQDSMGGANNPAGMAFAGDRLDLGLDWFQPRRGASRQGSMGGAFDFDTTSGSNHHFVPEVGYVTQLDPVWTAGITVYGNGGMNTDYPGGQTSCGNPSGNVANPMCGSGRLTMDLMQLIVAPTVSFKLAPDHAIGISPLLAYQRFKMSGLQAFDNAPQFPPMTGNPGYVTDNGYDSSSGIGLRVGYQGRIGPVTLGAAYSPRLNMGTLDKYKGLFAGQGDFDIPANYGLGVAVTVMPALTLALDWTRIAYSGVPSVGNPSSNQAPLGSANGPGFGWKDIDVFKLGVQWQVSPQWTLRAGYNKGDNPITAADVSFNIIAPGVTKTHYTLGGTMQLGGQSELTLAYMYAPKVSVTGYSMLNAPNLLGAGNGGQETIWMKQQSLGVAWALRF